MTAAGADEPDLLQWVAGRLRIVCRGSELGRKRERKSKWFRNIIRIRDISSGELNVGVYFAFGKMKTPSASAVV
jgi:hypothetical protein